MAYEDDLLNAAQKRTRTGRSFFPAANYSNGQTLIPSRYGTSSAVLPPDQNPAYQAAIANNPTPASRYAAAKSGASDFTWVTTPSGGQIRVPTSSLGPALTAVPGSTVQPAISPAQYASTVKSGYGAPTPTIQGGYQIAGGVANPIENLTPQARIAGGAGSALDYFRSNPALTAATNALSGFGNSIARFFSNPVNQNVQEVNQPTNFGMNGNFSNPPRRYSDYY